MEIMLKNTRLLEKNMIKTRSTPASFSPVTVKWTTISKQKKILQSNKNSYTGSLVIYKKYCKFFAKFIQNGKAHAHNKTKPLFFTV